MIYDNPTGWCNNIPQVPDNENFVRCLNCKKIVPKKVLWRDYSGTLREDVETHCVYCDHKLEGGE